MIKLYINEDYEIKDLAFEHEQHYSDEWHLLKDKCSACYSAVKNIVPIRNTERTIEENDNALRMMDYTLTDSER